MMKLDHLIQLVFVGFGIVNPWQDVNNSAVGGAGIGCHIAVQRSLDDLSNTKVDGHLRHGSHRFPHWFELIVDKAGYRFVGEQHGSRKSGVGSRESMIELSEQLKQ